MGNKGLTEKEKAREKKFEKSYQRKSAINIGNDYFNNVISALEYKLEDTKKDQKHWMKAINNGTYPNSKPLGNDLKVNQIIWTINSLQQINLYHELGARAVAKLTVAFDIDL